MAKAKAAPAAKPAAAKPAATKPAEKAVATPTKTKSAPAASSKTKMTKTQFMQELIDSANKTLPETSQLKKAEITAVYEAMIGIIQKELGPKGPGEVTLPNVCKLSAIHTKADKGGKKIANPFKPGEMMVTKPKPARTKVKVRGLKNFLETIAPKK